MGRRYFAPSCAYRFWACLLRSTIRADGEAEIDNELRSVKFIIGVPSRVVAGACQRRSLAALEMNIRCQIVGVNVGSEFCQLAQRQLLMKHLFDLWQPAASERRDRWSAAGTADTVD
jgi:hypothetical protein